MRLLSIVVLGGSGFLGTRLVARLIKDGHRVTVLSRDREQHKHLLVLPGLTLENCDVYQEAQLSERFRGKDVVINLIGILNESGFGGGGFRRAHTELTRGVLQAARSAGVGKLLQMSALKAAVDAPSYYLRSKGRGGKVDPRTRRRRGLDHLQAIRHVRTRGLIPQPILLPAEHYPARVSSGAAQRTLPARVRRRCHRTHF